MQSDSHEECTICDRLVDSNEPGHFKSPDERFQHAVCHESGTPPNTPIEDLSSDDPQQWDVTRQYNCGHYSYGLRRKLSERCPTCDSPQV